MNACKFGNSGLDVLSTFACSRTAVSQDYGGSKPRNRILLALPREVRSSVLPHLKREYLPPGKVLYDIDEPVTRVGFVERGLVCIMAVFADRSTSEMATVGPEGLVGVGSVLGGEQRALGRYVVPMPTMMLAIEASRFRSALRESSEFRAACEAYAQAFLREALQNAACNSVHMVEERCARWLLRSHDRNEGDTLTLTQEYLAEMLGVCRSTVTLAAGVLQRAGLIRYRRGAIRVLDRPGLEAAACECYRLIRDQYDRLLPGTYDRQLSLVDAPYLSRAFG
jgi:CRP-like cAMP-binding protein